MTPAARIAAVIDILDSLYADGAVTSSAAQALRSSMQRRAMLDRVTVMPLVVCSGKFNVGYRGYAGTLKLQRQDQREASGAGRIGVDRTPA